MKKLLTTITLSALVGTSASNLKPMFTNNVVNHGFKSNHLNKDISIKNENDTNPFLPIKISNINVYINVSSSSSDGTIYVGTQKNGLWKSSDGINFNQITNGIPTTSFITSIAIAPNGNVYIGDSDGQIWKSSDGINFNQMINDTGIPKIKKVPRVLFVKLKNTLFIQMI